MFVIDLAISIALLAAFIIAVNLPLILIVWLWYKIEQLIKERY